MSMKYSKLIFQADSTHEIFQADTSFQRVNGNASMPSPVLDGTVL